jgi:hypothetical protein
MQQFVLCQITFQSVRTLALRFEPRCRSDLLTVYLVLNHVLKLLRRNQWWLRGDILFHFVQFVRHFGV